MKQYLWLPRIFLILFFLPFMAQASDQEVKTFKVAIPRGDYVPDLRNAADICGTVTQTIQFLQFKESEKLSCNLKSYERIDGPGDGREEAFNEKCFGGGSPGGCFSCIVECSAPKPYLGSAQH